MGTGVSCTRTTRVEPFIYYASDDENDDNTDSSTAWSRKIFPTLGPEKIFPPLDPEKIFHPPDHLKTRVLN